MSTRRCARCRQTKPLEDFPLSPKEPEGRGYRCKECKAAVMRDVRAEQPREERNAQMQAYKAGMRKDKCALCGSAVDGYGICDSCMAAIKVLGDSPEALKRAAKALKWVQEQ